MTAPTASRTGFVVAFADGDGTMVDSLGGKGAGLAQMTRLGLPVPAGFTVTTEACRAYLAAGREPPLLAGELATALALLEERCGRRLGDPARPLLVSVRSGARFSMPGMMETILNVGLNDAVVAALAVSRGARFAWDSYRRLVQMYGRTVLGIEGDLFEARLRAERAAAGVSTDQELSAGRLEVVTRDFRVLCREQTGEDLPQDPHEQLHRSVLAVFESWTGDRARRYRVHEHISEDLGTAVNIVQMVFGNGGPRSGSGVCFTRNPATGEPVPYGDYLVDAQGEDVVNGSRQTMDLTTLAAREPALHAELCDHLRTLERHYRDLCDVEFTIEDGRLWILQTRVGKRSAAAAFRIACDLVDEGVIDLDEALLRVDGHQLAALLHPGFADSAGHPPAAHGLAASPGAATGRAVFDAPTAMAWAARGEQVVLLRPETSADDVGGLLAATAVITARGGLTSHAAVVARGFGKTCVTGVEGLDIDSAARTAVLPGGHLLAEGDALSVDGTTGDIFLGSRQVVASAGALAIRAWTTSAPSASAPYLAEADPVVRAMGRLLAHADLRRTCTVRANAETFHDARAGRELGAEGIGLARTEHMLLGDRRVLVEQVVTGDEREAGLRSIEALARTEFEQILGAMDGLPTVVRLLDPPLHEFLPDLVELEVRAAVDRAAGTVDDAVERRLALVRRWHEQNPMLGLRGVRLLAVVPELVTAQVRALAQAAVALRERGLDPRPEVMVPLVADVGELEAALASVRAEVAAVVGDSGTELDVPLGVMIELPRAALTAARLAEHVDFFSFGTNDLTQTTWGMSRDDAETSFLAAYRGAGTLASDPFSTLDDEGVGRLVRLAVTEGRLTRPDLGLGVCGEHAGDPASIHLLLASGVDYLSCSPPRVPVARLEAGRYAVLGQSAATAPETR
ncbi:pyruvate, phosphate dikinase [Pedococcus sp. KACC 23699]|uniref:Pyruvate, phosphate dikinase n=1 Tax=Pedococcus sp. KACC 23699 TaxID=3149228 RepID=A0AAU7JSM4_9MICO